MCLIAIRNDLIGYCRPEVNIKPWEELKEDMKEGNQRIKWEDREPYAFWKGNTKLSAARGDLIKCNTSNWKAHIMEMVHKS